MSAPYYVAIGPGPEREAELYYVDYVDPARLERRGWTVVAWRQTIREGAAAQAHYQALPPAERWWEAVWQHRSQGVE